MIIATHLLGHLSSHIQRALVELILMINIALPIIAPGKPKVDVDLAKDGSIELSWELKCKNGIIEEYRVTYLRMDDSADTKTLIRTNEEVRIRSLTSGNTYEFRVRTQTYFQLSFLSAQK